MNYDPIKQLFGTERGTAIEDSEIAQAVKPIAQSLTSDAVAVAKPVLQSAISSEIAKLPSPIAESPEVAVLAAAIEAAIGNWEIKL